MMILVKGKSEFMKNIKDVQKVILDIMSEIDKICNENNLRYFAIGGTCLGAVRHKGFIPWDDDLDIAMPRKDYELFKKIASECLPSYLCIMDENKTEHFAAHFMKVHNINTTFIEEGKGIYPDRYTGVYVDIMPLDGIPNNRVKRWFYFKVVKLLLRLNSRRKRVEELKRREKDKLLKYFFWNFIYVILECFPNNFFEEICTKFQSRYDYEESENLSYTWSLRMDEILFSKKCFEDYRLLPFEDMFIRCPIGYEEFLSKLFGNYMQLPPEEQRIPCHKTDIIDLDRPYSYYIEKGEKE